MFDPLIAKKMHNSSLFNMHTNSFLTHHKIYTDQRIIDHHLFLQIVKEPSATRISVICIYVSFKYAMIRFRLIFERHSYANNSNKTILYRNNLCLLFWVSSYVSITTRNFHSRISVVPTTAIKILSRAKLSQLTFVKLGVKFCIMNTSDMLQGD